jgi:hypothetical protein
MFDTNLVVAPLALALALGACQADPLDLDAPR